MALFLLVAGLAVVTGAASFATGPVLLAAVVLIGGWLLAFAVRERVARAGTGRQGTTAIAARPPAITDADNAAVAGFIAGLLGLFALNAVLGPVALALGSLALTRGTTRRTRALLAIGLGVLDLAIFATLLATHGGVSWRL